MGRNYFVSGSACTFSGDPHYSVWNGARHDFQGLPNGQYYYVTPCHGATYKDMPFNILAKHRPWRGKSVEGMEYFTFELFDDDGQRFYVFFSSSFQSVINAENATSTLYDDNMDSPYLFDLVAGNETEIGERFSVYFEQTDGNMLDAVIYIDGGCPIEFFMEGQVARSKQDGRWLMHYGFIHPPSCYKCFTCGLCGDFKRAKAYSGWEYLETCYGSTLPYKAGWGGENYFAFEKVRDYSQCTHFCAVT